MESYRRVATNDQSEDRGATRIGSDVEQLSRSRAERISDKLHARKLLVFPSMLC
jgi:hypothetical protein